MKAPGSTGHLPRLQRRVRIERQVDVLPLGAIKASATVPLRTPLLARSSRFLRRRLRRSSPFLPQAGLGTFAQTLQQQAEAALKPSAVAEAERVPEGTRITSPGSALRELAASLVSALKGAPGNEGREFMMAIVDALAPAVERITADTCSRRTTGGKRSDYDLDEMKAVMKPLQLKPYLSTKELSTVTPWSEAAIRSKKQRGEFVEGVDYFRERKGGKRGRILFKWEAISAKIERREPTEITQATRATDIGAKPIRLLRGGFIK